MNLVTRLRSRQDLRTLAADAALAAFLILLTVTATGGLAMTPGLFDYHETVAQALWACAQMLPFALRRRLPQTAALSYVALVLAHLVFGPCLVFADLLAPLMLYSVIVYGDPRNSKAFIVLGFAVDVLAAALVTWVTQAGPRSAIALGGPNTGACATTYIDGLNGPCAMSMMLITATMTFIISICLLNAIIMAYWQRARLATVRMMQERNDSIKAREEEERRIAALAERARIARDMHDVVAHTLSIIIIQSDGGRYAGAHDPTVARHTMETIRHESERALHDMKRLLGVFGGSPHADYTDIDALVDQARTADGTGSLVRRVGGACEPQRLDAKASTAIYRMVQEALTNVRKYAGPNVDVLVDERWDETGLTITVADNGRGASSSLDGHAPGYGLIGMRERIEAVGGTVASGPRVGGGFAVTARVPFAGAGVADAGASPGASRATGARPLAAASAATTATTAAAAGRAPTPVPVAAPAMSQPIPDAGVPRAGRSGAPTASGGTGDPGTTSVPGTTGTTTGPGTTGGFGIPHGLAAGAPDGPSVRPAPPHAAPYGAPPHIPVAVTVRIGDALRALRSKPLDQADSIGGTHFNVIERMSRWTERHYLFVDVAMTLLLIHMLTATGTVSSGIGMSASAPDTQWLVTVLALTPLMFRRRFPESSALVVAILSALQLIFLESVTLPNFFALLALYSAVLYGREHAWRWASLAAGANAALLAVKVYCLQCGYVTLYDAFVGQPSLELADGYVWDHRSALFIALMYFAVVALLCAGSIVMARWSRSSGSNALVLAAREEALRAEAAKQRVLAANMERDRISASIQTEVTETLNGVIDKTVAGIDMLDGCRERGEQPAPEAVAEAFGAIGRQGRSALARMRELLRVLRETGFSDEEHEHEQPGMALRPAASLDDQLRHAAS